MKRRIKTELTLEEIRVTLLGCKGASNEIAVALGVRRSSVSDVLSGRDTSQRILDAARAKAEKLNRQERCAGSVA